MRKQFLAFLHRDGTKDLDILPMEKAGRLR